MAIEWGNIVGSGTKQGRIGIEVTVTKTSNTQAKRVTNIWFWSRYSVDDSNNTFYYNDNASSATTSKGSVDIYTTNDSGDGWSTSNQKKIASYPYTFTRGKSASTRPFAAKLTGIERVSGTMTASTSYTIPALDSWKVSFDPNDGSGGPAYQIKYYGEELKITTKIPTKSGYTFVEWKSTRSDGTYYFIPGGATNYNGSQTLVAQWKKNITLSYSSNGGSGAPSSQSATVYNNTTSYKFTLSSTKPTRTGYTFLGWSTSSTATSATYSPGDSITLSASDTLYAIWKKTINLTYNANGGTGVPSSQSASVYNANTSYTFTLSNTKPTRSGYTFVGWSKYNTTETADTYQPGGTITLSDSDTLYAIWKKTITLTHNANGGSNAPSSQSKTVYNATTSHTFTISTTKPTRSGYTFLGWSTSSTATSATYSAGGTITLSSSDTLYAIWEKVITLSYSSNGGSGSPSSQSATVYNATTNYKFTISSTKPTRTGYTFKGWSTSSTATSAGYSSGGSITLSSSDTLYAVWQINTYTITYNGNGGTGVPSNQTKTYGTNITLSKTVPTRSGYRFLGWGTSATGSVKYAPGATYSSNANVTLYAIWERLGILHINMNGTWGKGRVWINDNGTWKTGIVFQNVSGTWKQGGA
jgi:uncharacterized repeat protein (TIGR02543 family)